MKRGDVYLADLDPTKGSEQAGRRPVLIFEDDRLIPATLTVVITPFIGNVAMGKLPTCVFVPAGEGGLRQDSVAICHRFALLTSEGWWNAGATCPVSAWQRSSEP